MSEPVELELELRLNVKFRMNQPCERELRANLKHIAKHAFAEGMLSGDAPAEADRWHYEVVKPGVWWCNAHGRAATYWRDDGSRCCDPRLAGIPAPCQVQLMPITLIDEEKDKA